MTTTEAISLAAGARDLMLAIGLGRVPFVVHRTAHELVNTVQAILGGAPPPSRPLAIPRKASPTRPSKTDLDPYRLEDFSELVQGDIAWARGLVANGTDEKRGRNFLRDLVRHRKATDEWLRKPYAPPLGCAVIQEGNKGGQANAMTVGWESVLPASREWLAAHAPMWTEEGPA